MTTQLHKYQYKAKQNTAAAKAVGLVGTGKRVLELGSGPGSLTRLLQQNLCSVTALEYDPAAIEIVAQYCERVLHCDLNDAAWPELISGMEKFQAIVATDVLEHLYDPWRTLQQLHGLLAKGGCLVLSLPHVGHNAIIAGLLNGEFDYQPRGLLDKTHLRFFAIKDMQRLFDDAGFKIVEADFVVKTPIQTEFAAGWRRLPTAARQVLQQNRYGNVYQVIVRAVPTAAPGKALRLNKLAVPTDPGTYSLGARGSHMLGFLLSFISLRTRDRISAMLQRVGLRL